jgi:hypothetical protein
MVSTIGRAVISMLGLETRFDWTKQSAGFLQCLAGNSGIWMSDGCLHMEVGTDCWLG